MPANKAKRTLHLVNPPIQPHLVGMAMLQDANLRMGRSRETAARRIPSHDAVLARYTHHIEEYARKIRRSDDLHAIVRLLDQAVQESREFASADGLRAAAGRATREIDALQREVERLRELIHVDHLTGALNRSGLDQIYLRESSHADRSRACLGVTLIDIDDFKHINDGHGHQAGDAALVHLSQLIQRTIRPSDAVVRYGGEEFLLLLPGSDVEQALTVLERVRSELHSQPLIYAKRRVAFSFSGGVAIRKTGEARDAVIARADAALYRAKRAGKRCLMVAD